MYLAPFDNLSMVLVGDWIFGIFNVGFAYSLSMVADSVDYMEWKTGVRTNGTAYATYGLATKFGNAFGGSIGVLLLAGFGYVANAEQTPQALAGINTVSRSKTVRAAAAAAARAAVWSSMPRPPACCAAPMNCWKIPMSPPNCANMIP